MTDSPALVEEGREPENLTHCCVCGQRFSEPVENWDDYFIEVEDASFACEPCAKAEGYPSDA